MTRVLHVMDEFRASGAEMMLGTAAGLWADHGVSCDVVATGANRGAYWPVLEAAGYGVHHLPFEGSLRFLRHYAALIRSGPYDVVHVHTERAFVYKCIVARLAGARVVRTVHNAFPFEGRLAQRRAYQRRLARAVGTRFVAIGATVAENERERFSNPTHRIDNWIDVARFVPPTPAARESRRRRFGLSDGVVTVVTVGNCSPIKNHAGLLEALARIDDVDWALLHVGQEDHKHVERHLASSLGVEQRCWFLGRTDPLDALHAADLYTMPSLYEGLGLSTVEALATGLPIVLTDVPGNRDLRGMADRMIWSATSADDLSVALRTMMHTVIDDETDDAAARRAQHATVAERYSPEAGVAAYCRLYMAGRDNLSTR